MMSRHTRAAIDDVATLHARRIWVPNTAHWGPNVLRRVVNSAVLGRA